MIIILKLQYQCDNNHNETSIIQYSCDISYQNFQLSMWYSIIPRLQLYSCNHNRERVPCICILPLSGGLYAPPLRVRHIKYI